MKTQISTYFSLDCRTKVKKKIEFSHITNFFRKRQLFCNFPILTEFLDELLLKQLVVTFQASKKITQKRKYRASTTSRIKEDFWKKILLTHKEKLSSPGPDYTRTLVLFTIGDVY